jgi:H+/Cl- antiporter ClcA
MTPSPILSEDVGHLGQAELALLSTIFGALCGLVALAFIETLRSTERFVPRFLKRRAQSRSAGGCLLVALYRFVGVSAAGLGYWPIDAALAGAMPALALTFEEPFEASLTKPLADCRATPSSEGRKGPTNKLAGRND